MTIQPTPTRQAANGVRHYAKGTLPEIERKGDVYELPASTPGIPQKITVVPSNWIGMGGRVDAVDAAGEHLKCQVWDNVLLVTDARTGVTTRVNRETLDVTVSEEIKSKTRPILYGCKTTSDCRLSEKLEANGDIRVRTSYHSLEERHEYGMVRDMPPSQSITTALDENYEETLIHGTDIPVTRVIFKQRHVEPVEKGTFESRVDQSGDLVISRADGSEETYNLFIAPHEMAR